MKYLNLIKWPYLLFLVLAQVLIKYTFFTPLLEKLFGNPIPITLNGLGFGLLCTATVFLAAAGFIIKKLYDVGPQTLNSPFRMVKGERVMVKKAFRLFFIFNILGMLIGFYLANVVGYPSFAILFILASGLLYASAKGLKKYILIRPLILAFLGGLSILGVALFDLFPSMTPANGPTLTTFFSIVKDYALLVALLLFVREQIVQQNNIDHDHRNGWNSLSLSMGKERTNQLIFVLTLLPAAAVIFYLYKYLYVNSITLGYGLALVLAPLLYVAIRILSAKTEKDYKHLILVMDLILIFSVLSISLYQIILQ